MTYAQLIAYIDGLNADGSLSPADYQAITNYIIAGGELENTPRDLIQVRRGNEETLPLLAQGEMGFTLDRENLFIGGLNGNVKIGDKQFVSVKDYGAIGNGVANDTLSITAALTNKSVVFPEGVYKASRFTGSNKQKVVGLGDCSINLFYADTEVLAVFGNDSVYENITFNCLETDRAWLRTSLENSKNIIFKNCRFKGFRNPTLSVAWGLYMKNTKNITLDNCGFADNTQADIAILEGTENIVILNTQELSGVYPRLNIEPNSSINLVKDIVVLGGRFKSVTMFENSNTEYSISNVVFNGCTIDELVADGANASFVNCKIVNIEPEETGGVSYAGNMDFGVSLSLGKNLIPDPRVISLSRDDTSVWGIDGSSLSPTNYWSRINDTKIGKATRLNPTAANGYNAIKMKSIVDGIIAGKKYLIALTSRVLYQAGAAQVGKFVKVNFYNSANALISTVYVQTNRAVVTSPVETYANTEHCVVKAPPNATKFNVSLGNGENNTTNVIDIICVSFHEILEDSYGSGNADQLKELHTQVVGASVSYAPTQPKDFMYYPNYFVGDKLIIPPVSGAYEAYVCTVAGVAGGGASSQGTFKGVGLIQ